MDLVQKNFIRNATDTQTLWRSQTDSKAFIFSFKNNENKPFIKKINPSYVNSAFYMHPKFGPAFGYDNSGRYAIFVSDNSNQNNTNIINFESHVYSNVNDISRFGLILA